MTLAAFLTLVALHLLAAVSPGPSFVVAVRTAAAEGFRVAAGLALGFGIGAVVWALAALLGLAVLFQVVPAVLTFLKFAGAAFLLWLAWQTMRHARDPLPEPAGAAALAVPRSGLRAVRLGVLTQLANPKPAVFFGAVFVGLVPPGTSLPWLALVLAVVLVNETAWYVLVARLFSGGRSRAAYGRFKIWIDRTFGGVLAAMGLAIVTR